MGATRDTSQATVRVLADLQPYLSEQLRGSDASKQDIAVQQITHVLSTPGLRVHFWRQRDETIKPMIDILKSAAGLGTQSSSSSLWNSSANGRSAGDGQLGAGVGIQLLYHVLFAVWQISFDADKIGDDLNEYVTWEALEALLTSLLTTLALANTTSSSFTRSSSKFLRRRRSPGSLSPRSETFSKRTKRRCFPRPFWRGSPLFWRTLPAVTTQTRS